MADLVHIIKLCVGAEGPEDLLAWQRSHFGARPPVHVTRMWPKRADDVLAGGSLYWVFKGMVLGRQRITALEQVTGGDGISRCAIVLDPELIRTEPLPRRPFQGWRYLAPADAPRDLLPGREREDPLPRDLLAALAEIGLR
ncbi:lysophospholipase [Rhodobacter veldkampii DSM 11550]|uniref:DUF1489 domain-containing protein n=1 Tax=Phaeovulum veldkampii DSM 11550 TaxID=1185920 RepID=A0A2T4JLC9_9RHOB|nr:DUF1489 domain-containing protein [Phaeovulum veldkampii]MBK5947395.1 lysophospholipase [Phaeovulum veldkampii DSM 11550]PTE18567.1 DUF1489 domain-containing protein [Phaeovulum veldkampii DSM 11550]TDQ59140.1 hypothetical protein EV658_10918 [Phaeovulum veldkampii DSM 11550]